MPLKTKLKDNKLHVKAKLSFAKSRSSGDGYDGTDSKRSGGERNKRVKSSGNEGNEWLKWNSGKWSGKSSKRGERKGFGNDENEGFKRSSGKSSTRDERKGFGNEGSRLDSGNRSGKMRTKFGRNEVGNDGDEGFKSRNLDNKRKRGYTDRCSGNGEKPNWGALLKAAGNKVKEYVGTRKQTFKVKSQNLDVGGEMEEQKTSVGSEFVEKKKSRSLSKLKAIDTVDDAGVDRMRKRVGKSVPERRKQLDQNKTKGAGILKRSTKKVQGKKSTGDDAEEVDEKPKKKKRVIRLDPNDTSNKRIVDDLPTKDGEEKKKDVTETSNVELSKNAQFRAICPSPSILSFVEENLLGRRREIEIKRAGYNIELSAPLDNIPFSTSTERERIEEPAFRNKLSFFAAAKASSSFPPPDLPEIAFAGRSNVGKSSLLNSLTRQWGVVRTSDKPGLTQTINFFKLEPKLCLVDLPGYGFAYAKEEVKEAWEDLVKEYVSTRVGLKRVCLLVDTKWGMKPRDYELVDLMERSQTKYQIVLTKTDLVFPIDVARRAMQIEESLKKKKAAVQPVMMVSSKSGAGVGSLRTALAKIARFVKP